MAIIKINSDEESVKFLKNQSSILHTSDTNNITVNAVNVIVDRPKVGDVMCVTRYKDKNNSLLPADKQKVIWIDGLSINPKQLSQKYEPVGICVAVKGNKAMVRYRKEESYEWSTKARLELQITNEDIRKLMTGSHTFKIFLINNTQSTVNFVYNYTSSSSDNFKLDFSKQLNNYFKSYNNNYSAELVAEDTDLPGSSRIIVNAPYNSEGNSSFSMEEIGGTNITIESILATGKPIKAIEQYYINNGFTRNYEGGCCRAKYYDYYSSNGSNPSYGMASINTQIPVSLSAFTSNPNCKVLRDNFATYDEYVDSMMVKYQCGKYGISNEFSSGKENTYKLANCTYIYNYASEVSEQNTLYPAANWAASIDINAPGLQAGNWWLPSAAEMVQMMRNITYGTSFWETKPDIVNRVLYELNNFDSKNWSMLSASTNRWTSSICGQKGAYFYYSFNGILGFDSFNFSKFVAPITLYEF